MSIIIIVAAVAILLILTIKPKKKNNGTAIQESTFRLRIMQFFDGISRLIKKIIGG